MSRPTSHVSSRPSPRFAFVCVVFFCLVAEGCNEPEDTAVDFPRKPIKLIVPFAAGGGSDTFGRIIQHAIDDHELLPQPLVIVNVPGAGGTVGSRRVKNARPDGYTLMLLHEGILTAKHSGRASYGSEAFEPIAGTGNALQVVAVEKGSRFGDLGSLMDEVTSHPDEIVFSANIGAPSHFAGLMLQAQRDGASFRYTQNGGGAKRLHALQGGHVDVSAFSIAEYVQFRGSGLRALALLGDDRHPELPDLATAKELGYDVVSQNMQFWWAPAGTSQERIDTIATAIEAAMKTDQVRQRLSEMNMSDVTLVGESLVDEIAARDERIASVAITPTAPLPNFPLLCLGATIAFALLGWYQSRRASQPIAERVESETDSTDSPDQQTWLVISVAAAVLVYVGAMQLRLLPFTYATILFVGATGARMAISAIQTGRMKVIPVSITLVVVALTMSFAVNFLFTNVLVVDLP